MPSPRAEFFLPSRVNRAVRWLLPAALLALTPKCLLCILAYAGLGTALGLGGPEMCGASSGWLDSWASWLAWAGAALAVTAMPACLGRRRVTSGRSI